MLIMLIAQEIKRTFHPARLGRMEYFFARWEK